MCCKRMLISTGTRRSSTGSAPARAEQSGYRLAVRPGRRLPGSDVERRSVPPQPPASAPMVSGSRRAPPPPAQPAASVNPSSGRHEASCMCPAYTTGHLDVAGWPRSGPQHSPASLAERDWRRGGAPFAQIAEYHIDAAQRRPQSGHVAFALPTSRRSPSSRREPAGFAPTRQARRRYE